MLTSSGLCLACGLKHNPDIPHKYLSQLPEQWRRCLTTSSLCGSFPSTCFREPPCAQGKGQLLSQLQSAARGASREETHPGALWGAVAPLHLNTKQDPSMEYSVTELSAWGLTPFLPAPDPGGLRTQGLAEARVVSPAVGDATVPPNVTF